MASRSPSSPGAAPSSAPRRKFMPDEDVQLRNLAENLGTKSWEEIARFMPDRTARQCRDRYKNYLTGDLVTDPWTPEEDALVVRQFDEIGPKWVRIGKMLSGRSGNNVKNRWHKHLCRMWKARETAEARGSEGANGDQAVPRSDPDWLACFDTLEPSFTVDHPWGGEFSFEDSLL
jgi:hypothetical protein